MAHVIALITYGHARVREHRDTGRPLFHSDDELAMTTNFVEDTGRGPALRSLLRSESADGFNGLESPVHSEPAH